MKIAQSIYRKPHYAQMKKSIPAFRAFYNSQSDEQKKITDSIPETGKFLKRHKKK